MNSPVSTCCGAPPLGETHFDPLDLVGICSACRDHCCFEDSSSLDDDLGELDPSAACSTDLDSCESCQ